MVRYLPLLTVSMNWFMNLAAGAPSMISWSKEAVLGKIDHQTSRTNPRKLSENTHNDAGNGSGTVEDHG